MIAPCGRAPRGIRRLTHQAFAARHPGLHAPAHATTRLETARRLLEAQQQEPAAPAATTSAAATDPADWREILRRLTGVDPTRCRHCGGTLRSTSLSVPPLKPPDDTS